MVSYHLKISIISFCLLKESRLSFMNFCNVLCLSFYFTRIVFGGIYKGYKISDALTDAQGIISSRHLRIGGTEVDKRNKKRINSSKFIPFPKCVFTFLFFLFSGFRFSHRWCCNSFSFLTASSSSACCLFLPFRVIHFIVVYQFQHSHICIIT